MENFSISLVNRCLKILSLIGSFFQPTDKTHFKVGVNLLIFYCQIFGFTQNFIQIEKFEGGGGIYQNSEALRIFINHSTINLIETQGAPVDPLLIPGFSPPLSPASPVKKAANLIKGWQDLKNHYLPVSL